MICEKCGRLLGHLGKTRTFDNGTPAENLASHECVEYTLPIGCIDPWAGELDESYLLYNERTTLFDEYDKGGVLFRSNVIPSPIASPTPRRYDAWPTERRKPKRVGDETWLRDIEVRNIGHHRNSD